MAEDTLEILYFVLLNHFNRCLAFWQLKGSLDDPKIKSVWVAFLQDGHQPPAIWPLFSTRLVQRMIKISVGTIKKSNKNRQEKKIGQKAVASNRIKSLRRVPTTEAVYHGKSDQFSIHNGKLWNKFVKFLNFWKPTESMLCSLLCRSEIKYVYCYQLSGHCCPKQQEWLVSECFNVVKMCDTSNYSNVQLLLHFCHILNIRFFFKLLSLG